MWICENLPFLFQPKDMARINEKRREFAQVNQGNISSNQRYHAEEVEERFAKYKPGVVRSLTNSYYYYTHTHVLMSLNTFYRSLFVF